MTLKEHDEFELLITSVSVIYREHHLWRQVSTLIIEKAQRLNENVGIRLQHHRNDTGKLAQVSRKPNTPRETQSAGSIRCFYYNKNGQNKRDYQTRAEEQRKTLRRFYNIKPYIDNHGGEIWTADRFR